MLCWKCFQRLRMIYQPWISLFKQKGVFYSIIKGVFCSIIKGLDLRFESTNYKGSNHPAYKSMKYKTRQLVGANRKVNPSGFKPMKADCNIVHKGFQSPLLYFYHQTLTMSLKNLCLSASPNQALISYEV